MEQPVLNVICRDGVPARVQKVAYEGQEGGECFFGYRLHPDLPTFDGDGMRNESGDLWSLAGRWVNSMVDHPFDLVARVTPKNSFQYATAQ